MAFLDTLRALDRTQRHTVAASFLGWTLDAFDYFLLVFVIPSVAKDFRVGVTEVTFALLLTLAFRPLGALIFGRLADHFGRRRILMLDVVLYSALELACAFAPSLLALLVLRALFGIVSGILQSGYPCGYLLGAIAYGLLFNAIRWRGMFVLGVLPALLVLYIRRSVPESPVFEQRLKAGARRGVAETMRGHWGLFAYLIVLMAVFNMFSHGSQDVYPTFLKLQRHFDTHVVSLLTIVLNLGALAGGLAFGAWSERIGRRRAMVIAALLALPAIPLWSYGGSVALLAAGAFWIQVAVQGAWGVVPGYLNELSPDAVRGTLPGFAYQLGNLIAAGTATLLAWSAHRRGGDFAFAQSVWIAGVAVVLALLAGFGPEARGVRFGASDADGVTDAADTATSPHP